MSRSLAVGSLYKKLYYPRLCIRSKTNMRVIVLVATLAAVVSARPDIGLKLREQQLKEQQQQLGYNYQLPSTNYGIPHGGNQYQHSSFVPSGSYIPVASGGWHVLRNFHYDDFDYSHVLKQLHVKYGVSPYFKINVEPNPGSPGNSSIRISPSGLGLPDRKYYYTSQDDPIRQAYIQLIRDVAIILCKSTATNADADVFAKNMFHYEQRIADVTPEAAELQNPVVAYNPRKMSELALTDPKLPLQNILTAMYPDANVVGDTEVMVTSPDYMSKISQIISSTDRNTLNSYILWTLVREYIPYMSSEFVAVADSFNAKLLGIQQPPKRWVFCANLVRKHMGLALDALIEEGDPISRESRTVVQEIFDSVKQEVKQRLDNYKTSDDLHRHLSNKISGLKILKGLSDDIRDDMYIKDYYSKFHVLKADLFTSLKNGVTFAKKVEEKRLINTHPEDYVVSRSNAVLPQVTYLPSSNTIHVPRSLLTSPAFESKYPRSILFGRLGVELALAVVSSVLPYDDAWTADCKLLTAFHSQVNESMRISEHARSCLKDFINENQFANVITANLTSLASLKFISSLSIAHKALGRNAIQMEHIHQASLEKFEDSALFFLSFAQSQCTVCTTQQELYRNLVDFQLSQKIMFQLAWSQIPEFSSSLDCSYDKTSQCSDIL